MPDGYEYRTMPDENRELLRPGARLPALSLPRIPSGEPVAWRPSPRGARLLIFLADPDESAARAYIERLRHAYDRFRIWDGQPALILPGRLAELEGSPLSELAPFPVLADAEGAARRRCGLASHAAGVIVADRWGEVYHISVADSARDLPEPVELEEWLRFIATQCPECGVPDAATRGEWAEEGAE